MQARSSVAERTAAKQMDKQHEYIHCTFVQIFVLVFFEVTILYNNSRLSLFSRSTPDSQAESRPRKRVFFLFVIFVPRYMQPEGLLQRLCRCPLRGNGGLF